MDGEGGYEPQEGGEVGRRYGGGAGHALGGRGSAGSPPVGGGEDSKRKLLGKLKAGWGVLRATGMRGVGVRGGEREAGGSDAVGEECGGGLWDVEGESATEEGEEGVLEDAWEESIL